MGSVKRKKPTQAQKDRLWKYVVAQVDRLKLSGSESIHQSDEPLIFAAEFFDECAQIVGFWKDPEDG